MEVLSTPRSGLISSVAQSIFAINIQQKTTPGLSFESTNTKSSSNDILNLFKSFNTYDSQPTIL